MKKLVLVLPIISILFLLSCNQNKPIACTQEAKICPDGSAVGRTGPNCEFAPCPSADTTPNQSKSLKQNYCTPTQKQGDFCIELYQPVCGWLDPKQIQCIKYPCANTFSNSCFACHDNKVLYWTDGKCPTSLNGK